MTKERREFVLATLLIVLLVFLFVAKSCKEGPTVVRDQCLRAKLYDSCMATYERTWAVTKGVDMPKWTYAESSCQNMAAIHSERKAETVEASCRSN